MIEGQGLEGIEIHGADVALPDLSEKLVLEWFKTIAALHTKQLNWISLVFCSDEYLLDVNRQHLEHDYYTDIISFPISYEPISCELFISLDRVKDNAMKEGLEWPVELLRVMSHGLLHMIGFEDDSPEKKLIMRKEESRCIELWKAPMSF